MFDQAILVLYEFHDRHLDVSEKITKMADEAVNMALH